MYGIYENGTVIARFTAPLTVKSNQPISVSDTLSLKRQVSKRAAQRWEITAGVEPLSYDAQDLFVNLVTKGFSETVTVLMPQNFGAYQNSSFTAGTPVATGAIAATQINITGFIGKISKGTFVKFNNHSKIYLVTSSVNSILSTNTYAMNIFPSLQATLSNTEFKYRNDVLMSALYDTDVVSGMTYEDGILMNVGELKIIEKL